MNCCAVNSEYRLPYVTFFLLLYRKVPDFQVKLCPGAGHGFAHRPMKKDEENAEDAMLLATSWLDIYMQKHFRIEAEEVKESEFEFWELPARSAPSR